MKRCNKDCLNCIFPKCKYDIEDERKAIDQAKRRKKKEENRLYNEINRERNRERSRLWYQAHREEHNARAKARYKRLKNEKKQQAGYDNQGTNPGSS